MTVYGKDGVRRLLKICQNDYMLGTDSPFWAGGLEVKDATEQLGGSGDNVQLMLSRLTALVRFFAKRLLTHSSGWSPSPTLSSSS